MSKELYQKVVENMPEGVDPKIYLNFFGVPEEYHPRSVPRPIEPKSNLRLYKSALKKDLVNKGLLD